jgi:putative acetyltransferase
VCRLGGLTEAAGDSWPKLHRGAGRAWESGAAKMSHVPAVEALEIRREDLDCPQAKLLIDALNLELAACYPEPGANHFSLDVKEVAPQNGAFLIGYLAAEPVTCGAIRRIEPRVAEIKRMYVVPSERGRGIAKIMLTALEERARGLGIGRLVLETGTRQLKAIALYRGAGFNRIARFGEYVSSELSVCMGKDLS